MKKKVRTIWISDVHLGTRFAQDTKLLLFLREYSAATVFLVGDIIDGWALHSSWHWPQSHTDLVRELLNQKRVIYLIGNHDEFLRHYLGEYGNVTLTQEAEHILKDGKKLLVTHGDSFDLIVKNAKWLAHLGDWGYDVLLVLNKHLARLLAIFGYKWSLSAWVKHHVKGVVSYISGYQRAMLFEAKRVGADGIVCGHIHHAEKKKIGDFLYCNTGDWVESCTALVEDLDGKLRIVKY